VLLTLQEVEEAQVAEEISVTLTLIPVCATTTFTAKEKVMPRFVCTEK
jgi:hypothetical protein